ncbi:MAG: CHAT domain-containing protein [Bacteroidota bacterium]|nr:CHAT domain-containing protein [Bacteroidota bacterium]
MQKQFCRYILTFLLITSCVFFAEAQSYKQLILDFEQTYQSKDYGKRFEIANKLKKNHSKELQKEPMRIAELDNAAGDYYLWTGNYDSSQVCYARAVNGVYMLKTDTCFDYAFYLANMAYVLKEMGYYETSDKYYGVALPRLANYLGASSEEYTAYVKHFVDLKVDMGDYVTANTYNEALIYYYKTTKGEVNDMYLACLTNKGRILQGNGQYNEAILIFSQLVYSTQLNFPADTLTQTITLNNLAYCYRLVGKNEEAEKYFIEAYRLQTKCTKIPLAEQASLLNNLAIVYKAKCDYANAEKCFLKSIELYQKANMQFNVEFANPCNNLGDMYRMLGNYNDAYKYISFSLEIRRQTSGEEHEYFANALNNMALLYFEWGKYDEAEKCFLRCEEIYKAKLGEDNDRSAAILNQLGSLYSAKNDYTKALEYKNKCLQLMEKTVGRQNDRYGLFLSGKGSVQYRMKDYKGAAQSYQEAASIFQNNFGVENYNYLDMMHSLAFIYDRSGNNKESRNCHLKSIYGYKKVVSDNLAFMGDEERTMFYTTNSGKFETFERFVIKKIIEKPDTKDDSLLKALVDERLWSKSLLLNESSAMFKNINNTADTTIRSLFELWYNQKKSLHQLYQFSKEELSTNKIDINEEENYLNDIEKKLSVSSAQFTKAKEFLNFETLKKKLNKSELAVEIIRNEISDNDSAITITYSALIIGKDFTAPKLVVFDSSAFFDTLFLDKYKFNIQAKTTDRISYNRFFRPLEKYLRGAAKIYFSPDGVYQKLNLYTLFNPISNKYLLETMEIEQVSALNDLQKETTEVIAQPSAVLFGYPDYEWKKDPSAGSGSGKDENLIASRFGFSELPELPGTKVETEMISSVFKSKNWNTKLYLAKEATEEQVKATVSPTILHIATHGFFLPNLDYSDEKVMGFETEKAKQNPLLRSGVIMAGAASKDTTIEKKEDGILTAYEASLLNLQNTELVTLSACETGLGDQLLNGQGVYGLQRAFLTAGAKSILMSLWVVDDYATQELMTNFYTDWIQNYSPKTKRTSFRKAQLEVKKKYPSPYYWGAFVMIGK